MEQLSAKILLFGEYAVLHQGMALVIPCDKYQGRLDFYEKTTHKKSAIQSNEFLKKFCEFIAGYVDEKFVLEVQLFERELERGLFFNSTIPQGYGLGSSGALVAAIFLRYLKRTKDLKDELKVQTFQKLNKLKNELGKLESYFHGVSSGLDPLSIILSKPILYNHTKNIVITQLPKTSGEKNHVIFLLNTKFPHSTSEMIRRFNSLYSKGDFKNKFEEHIVHNNNRAIRSLLKNNPEDFYRSLYHLSAFQLTEMKGFFPEPLQKEVSAGLDNGDYFLKLCGAGGGGFLLGFTQNWAYTREKLKAYKLEVIYSY